MKRFGFGLLAAGLLAAATLLTTVPAMADRGGGGFGGGFGNGFGGGMGGMIWLPPRGGMGGWNGAGMRGPGPGWNGGGRNVYRGSNHYNRRWNGNWNGRNWNGQRWNGRNWHGRNWNNWYRNGRWYGPRYRYRYPGYNYFYSGFWYPWPWWSYNGGGWGFEVGDAFAGGSNASQHVQWCMNRYRSYNPRTDTYTGYDGKKHRCRGPY